MRSGRRGVVGADALGFRRDSLRLPGMALGQHPGPPASAKQLKELLTLLKNVGHSDFRDARGPMGFTQRQAAGKFTRDEAAAFIDRLQDTEFGGSAPFAGTVARLSTQEQRCSPHACRAARRRASASRLDRDQAVEQRAPASCSITTFRCAVGFASEDRRHQCPTGNSRLEMPEVSA